MDRTVCRGGDTATGLAPWVVAGVLAATLGPATGPGAADAAAESSGTKVGSSTVQRLTALAGCWTGRDADGVAAEVSYEVTNGGAEVMELLRREDAQPLLTLYHLEGATAVAYHFCRPSGSPIQMRAATSSDAESLRFEPVDGIDRSCGPESVTAVRFTFRGRDRFQAEWSLKGDGAQGSRPFIFRRAFFGGCEVRKHGGDW